MAKKAGFTQALTLSDFPGIDQETYIITEFHKTGDEQELIEVNDLSDDTMDRDYVLGLITRGEITVTLMGPKPNVEVGQTGTVSIDSATGPGRVTLASVPVVVTKTPDVDVNKTAPLSHSITYKVLPSGSRLLATGT